MTLSNRTRTAPRPSVQAQAAQAARAALANYQPKPKPAAKPAPKKRGTLYAKIQQMNRERRQRGDRTTAEVNASLANRGITTRMVELANGGIAAMRPSQRFGINLNRLRTIGPHSWRNFSDAELEGVIQERMGEAAAEGRRIGSTGADAFTVLREGVADRHRITQGGHVVIKARDGQLYAVPEDAPNGWERRQPIPEELQSPEWRMLLEREDFGELDMNGDEVSGFEEFARRIGLPIGDATEAGENGAAELANRRPAGALPTTAEINRRRVARGERPIDPRKFGRL